MYKLPQGEYTICVEFFPFVMSNVSVNAVSSSLNVGQQTTNLITKGVTSQYTRSIIHLHKYQISPPEYLMLDLHVGNSSLSSPPTLGQAYLIIYGVSGYHSDVPASVYDYPYILESGSIVMQAKLNMNNHAIINSPSLSKMFVINGNYNKSLHQSYIFFSGEQDFVLPVNCKITNCSLHIHDSLSSYLLGTSPETPLGP